MPSVEDYIDKKKYFDHLYEKIVVAIETSDYYHGGPHEKIYETIYLDVYSKLKEKKGEVEVIVTSLYIELHDTVSRAGWLSSSLVPQTIDYDLNETVLTYEGEWLFEEDWNINFEEALLKAIKDNIVMYTGLNSSGDAKNHRFTVRDIWIVE